MTTLGELQDRLAKLQEGLEELHELIERLGGGDGAKGSRNDSSTADEPDDLFLYDDDAAADLVAEIADGLREVQDDYELLQEDAADLALVVGGGGDRSPAGSSMSGSVPFLSHHHHAAAAAASASATAEDHDRARLKEGLSRFGKEIQQQHVAFRTARLRASRARAAAQREARQQLLASYVESEEEDDESEEEEEEEHDAARRQHHHHRPARPPQQRQPPPHASRHTPTTAAAADVTAALRQTHARIAGEVARSDFAQQTLAESSRALAELGDRYAGGHASASRSGMGDVGASLQAARGLVRGLVAAHKSDTWYLQAAFYLLAGTVAWLLFRRLLYGPLWLLVWWPLRLVFGTAVWVGRAGSGSGRGSGSPSSLSVSSHMGTTSYPADAPVMQATPSPQAGGGGQQPGNGGSNNNNNNGDSLVEEVGRIVEGEGAGAAGQGGSSGGGGNVEAEDQPNPRKRMWEEPVEAAKYEEQKRKEEEGRKKDEL